MKTLKTFGVHYTCFSKDSEQLQRISGLTEKQLFDKLVLRNRNGHTFLNCEGRVIGFVLSGLPKDNSCKEILEIYCDPDYKYAEHEFIEILFDMSRRRTCRNEFHVYVDSDNIGLVKSLANNSWRVCPPIMTGDKFLCWKKP